MGIFAIFLGIYEYRERRTPTLMWAVGESIDAKHYYIWFYKPTIAKTHKQDFENSDIKWKAGRYII